MTEQFKYLFSPFKIGSVTIPNRICTTAHGTLFADENNYPDERYAAYQGARAKGGAGLIIAGMMNVMPNCTNQNRPQEIFNPDVVPSLKRLADAVHEGGGKVFIQLVHTGREANIEATGLPAWAPSPLPDITMFNTVPKQMSVDDIQRVVAAFATAAGHAQAAGIDGVEIHGSSGYLVAQFMSPSSNKRTDDYGGSMDNRLRLPIEIIDAIRERVGDDFALGIRIPGDELAEGGNNFEDMKTIARKLEATGKLDYIHTGLPFYEGLFRLGFGMHLPLGLYTPYAAGFKEVVDLPIINNFRINDPVQAEKILENGQADFVGMTRALIADPELPNKARSGRVEEIRHCIGCNQGCFGRIYLQLPMSCLQNAAVGLENEIGAITPAETKKRILVVGGGPAGMETARVASLRGHAVVLYEKEDRLGGQVILASKTPVREEFSGCARYLIKQMEILGVDVHLGEAVTPEIVARLAPDAVVVATGSTPPAPVLDGADEDCLFTVWDVLQDKADVGDKVLVVDGGEAHWQCCGVVEYLAGQGKRVEVVTPMLNVGANLAILTDMVPFFTRALSKDVVFHPSSIVKAFSDDVAVLANVFSGKEERIEDVDAVVMAMHQQANNSLYLQLKDTVKEIYAVGDCLAPRKAINAIHDGYKLGRTM